jgi:hypothetical protein
MCTDIGKGSHQSTGKQDTNLVIIGLRLLGTFAGTPFICHNGCTLIFRALLLRHGAFFVGKAVLPMFDSIYNN